MADFTDDEPPRRAKKDDLAEADLWIKLKKWFLEDADHCRGWHEKARSDFAFKANKQWDDKTVNAMSEGGSGPPIVFNMSLAVILAVAGIEINGRHEVSYMPRDDEEGDIVANELLTGASQWMAQECDGEDEESEAFEEALDCGMGFTENVMDYVDDPDGMYVEKHVSALEMFWDKRARKKNISDAKRIWRVRKMPLSDARDLMQGYGIEVDDADLHCPFAIGVDTKEPESVETRRLKLDDGRPIDDDTDVSLIHAQWVELEPFHRAVNPMTGKIEEFDNDGLKALQAEINANMPEHGEIKSVQQRRRVYKQAFIGSKILFQSRLEKDGSSLGHFTYQCITGYLDKTTGYYFGLISILRDPQKLVNKTLSKMIHVLSTTAQGGILAERGAFEDIREAQRTYARHDVITELAEGAISNNKIMQKPGGGNVAPFAGLLEYAVESLWRVTGLNPEILGQRNTEQAGVLEAQRKQAALSILAKLFDSLRRFRKNVGRIRLYYIQNFISDGRIVRIVGEEGKKGVRLLRDKTLGKYDVIVDDAPSSPNTRQQTFGTLMQLLPFFQQNMNAETAMVILEHSPLPSKVVESFRKIMSEPPGQEQQAAQQLQVADAQAEVTKKQAVAAKDFAQAEKTKSEIENSRTGAIIQMARASQAHQHADQAHKVKTDHDRVRMMGTAAKSLQDIALKASRASQVEPDAGPQPQPVPAPPQLANGAF